MSEKQIEGLLAKQLILIDLGLDEERANRLNSLADCDAMIAYLQNKSKAIKTNAAGQPEIKPDAVAKQNVGQKPSPQAEEEPYSAEELFDPRQVDVSRLNKLNDDDEIRILKAYDDDAPEGRIV